MPEVSSDFTKLWEARRPLGILLAVLFGGVGGGSLFLGIPMAPEKIVEMTVDSLSKAQDVKDARWQEAAYRDRVEGLEERSHSRQDEPLARHNSRRLDAYDRQFERIGRNVISLVRAQDKLVMLVEALARAANLPIPEPMELSEK